MPNRSISQAIDEFHSHFTVEIARSARQIALAHRLRHQVYCVERGFLSGDNGIEMDVYDAHSRHIVLMSRRTSEVMGTVRLVLSNPADAGDSFPMQQVCAQPLPPEIPVETTAEISRFAISRQRRDNFSSVMRLGLLRGIFDLGSELRLTHCCAVMEPALLRLLKGSGVHFRPHGPLVDYHGPRQPCYSPIDELLNGIKADCPAVWNLLTESGRFGAARPPRVLAAA
jgi:N-acyl-L-homoserine lactone synthetase